MRMPWIICCEGAWSKELLCKNGVEIRFELLFDFCGVEFGER